MRENTPERTLLARCVVCRGDIFEGDHLEEWEGGFYCERHSLAYLRRRARVFAEMVARDTRPEPLTE